MIQLKGGRIAGEVIRITVDLNPQEYAKLCLLKEKLGLPTKAAVLRYLISSAAIDNRGQFTEEELRISGMAEESGFVYFIRSNSIHEAIKIGFTAFPEQRLRGLNGSDPYGVRLLHLGPGTISDERRLHRRFRSLQIKGEWFRPDKALSSYIERLCKRQPSMTVQTDGGLEAPSQLDVIYPRC